MSQTEVDGVESVPTTYYEEEAIISLIIDAPDFFASIAHLIESSMFRRPAAQYVFAVIKREFTKHGCVPTRELLHDKVAGQLRVSDPYEQVLEIVDRKSNPRDIPSLKETVREWAEKKAYGLLYSADAIKAYEEGRYDELRKIFADATKIADTSQQGFWFFDQLDALFVKQQIKHYSTGFSRLDACLNEGGPSPGDVLLWMAATNIGKSILLANNAVYSIKAGLDTLFITFELSMLRTALRCLGALTDIRLKDFGEQEPAVRKRAMRVFNTHQAHLVIYEMPPAECSVSHLYAICESLRRSRNWQPKIIIADYLDLMVSREPGNNAKVYDRQKAVATELFGLAKNTKTLVYSATQTNRSGVGAGEGEVVDLDKAAESYGKVMPVPYVVTLNQSDAERQNNRIRLYIAKNTNGPKHETISCQLDYDKMLVTELL